MEKERCVRLVALDMEEVLLGLDWTGVTSTSLTHLTDPQSLDPLGCGRRACVRSALTGTAPVMTTMLSHATRRRQGNTKSCLVEPWWLVGGAGAAGEAERETHTRRMKTHQDSFT